MPANQTLRGVRTVLIAAGDADETFRHDYAQDADLWILDLEDLVPPGAKDAAREKIARLTSALSPDRRQRCYVRLTDCELSQGVITDLNLVSELRGVMLPKVERSEVVCQMAEQLNKMHGSEHPRDIIVTLETARGVVNAPQILESCDNVVGAVFGPSDLSRDLDLPPSSTAHGLAMARAQVLLAARSAGVAAIDGAFMIEGDLDGLKADAETARRLGYDAKLTVFPGHLAVVQEILAAERSDQTGSSRHPEGNRDAI